ncbi:hypothetical protein NPIL_211651 [Nephila pilipes]|uniref:Uncharacterized protein n=1 Tax=Nephila pilipes TaxID=299642 RepID=A0A8X6IUW7_NEPPI|nr:hypothetical protein NPIL_211651 [Nephila pilipes]
MKAVWKQIRIIENEMNEKPERVDLMNDAFRYNSMFEEYCYCLLMAVGRWKEQQPLSSDHLGGSLGGAWRGRRQLPEYDGCTRHPTVDFRGCT